MELTIECQKRAPGSKPNALRRSGLIPAVLYGHNGAESLSLTLSAKTVESLMKKASVNNTLIQMNIPDASWNGKALLREVQTHPWKGYPYHLSFFSIGTQESLQITVPIHFVGESIGVKNSGGVLDTVLTELEVQCPPDKIPDSIEVDVSSMDIGDALHVNELPLSSGVVALGEGERVVVSVIATRASTDSGEAAE
ncbi:MAG TPA: 50S ribosomal protein L25/general stress protein Ctc [Crinalium sp.]|jgi:large subunit ribosomal protein L25